MSALVEFPSELYDPRAFAGLAATSDFRLENALAMMWFSQLAYETGQIDTLEHAKAIWSFDDIRMFRAHAVFQPSATAPRRFSLDTRGVIGRKADAMVIAFGGTDPLVWENIWTDVDFVLDAKSDIHGGFQAAFDAVKKTIDQALGEKPRTLFIAGHSLGAALAVLAARRAVEIDVVPAAVYTFGMPRTGGAAFASGYNSSVLGERTYRLVHGLDVVPRVPPKIRFAHVGRMLSCESGARFKSGPLSELGDNGPSLVPGFMAGIFQSVANVFSGSVLSPPGPGPYGPLFRLLPQQIRDHLQDLYIAALTPH